MKPKIKIKGPGPKIRRPVQKKPNTTMKSKKTYTRKDFDIEDLFSDDYESEVYIEIDYKKEETSKPEFELGGDKESPDPDIGW